jgi:hypothetical protein
VPVGEFLGREAAHIEPAYAGYPAARHDPMFARNTPGGIFANIGFSTGSIGATTIIMASHGSTPNLRPRTHGAT